MILTSVGSISLLNVFWVTDCYAVKFILSYDGWNPAILRLQMRLMCWDVDIVYQPGTELVDSDYWSCIGVDLEYDPLYAQYLKQTLRLHKLHLFTVPMLPNITKVYRFNLLQMQLPLRLRMSRHCWRLLSLLRLSVLTHCVFMPIQLIRLPMLQSLTYQLLELDAMPHSVDAVNLLRMHDCFTPEMTSSTTFALPVTNLCCMGI
jgi:hypothetical protein